MSGSLLDQTQVNVPAQPWLRSARFDLFFIAAPAFITAFVALGFKDQFENMVSLPLWAWVSFVLLVDVAHVYATLFRTYFDKEAREKNATLLWSIPIACWALGALLYSLDGLLFWRMLAYLAVFHFIRQQFGFMALYSRADPPSLKKFARLDEACIYFATLYPLAYWHTNLPRNFSWFVEGDFAECLPKICAELFLVLYLAIGGFYLLKEWFSFRNTGFINIPKNLIILGTALSWWVAIVAINSDLSFTMVNVISHGVPYMALIWLYHHTKNLDWRNDEGGFSDKNPDFERRFGFGVRLLMAYLPAYLLLLCLFAYLEEGLWAGLVWREHLEIFRPFAVLPAVVDRSLLALLVPLLSLPQSTHYVLDGFIWRVKDRNRIWSA